MSYKKSQRGQTIVEALVALMIILVIVSAIAVVIVTGIYNASYIKNQNEANKYAQQAMEFLRDMQKNRLLLFASQPLNTTLCIDDTNRDLYSGSRSGQPDCGDSLPNLGNIFIRTIRFNTDGVRCPSNMSNGTPQVLATVTVKWQSSKCSSGDRFCHKSVLESCFNKSYNNRQP